MFSPILSILYMWEMYQVRKSILMTANAFEGSVTGMEKGWQL